LSKPTAIAATAVIVVLAGGAVAAAAAYEQPNPDGCAVLHQQGEHTSDVATLLDEIGCAESPAAVDPTARPSSTGVPSR
jgi:hypothetical protein